MQILTATRHQAPAADVVGVLTHGKALMSSKFVAPVLALPRAGLEPELGPVGDNRGHSLEGELGCTTLETGGSAGKAPYRQALAVTLPCL